MTRVTSLELYTRGDSRLRQFVALAPRPCAELVGDLGVVSGELPLLRVPGEPGVVPVGEVEQVARRHAAGADFHVADRPLAARDAVEPVAVVGGDALAVDPLRLLFAF